MWKSKRSWMHESVDIIGNRKLNGIIIPGSHDSSTYKVSKTQNIPLPTEYELLKCTDIPKKWARTQMFNIYDQLNFGVRYLDIRVTPALGSGELMCTHSFITIKLSLAFEHIKQFLTENPNEFIIIETRYDPLYSTHHKCNVQDLIDKYIAYFGLLVAEPISRSYIPTYNELMATPGRIVLFPYWNRSLLNIPWNDSFDPNVKFTLDSSTLHPNYGRFNGLSATVTPNIREVMESVFDHQTIMGGTMGIRPLVYEYARKHLGVVTVLPTDFVDMAWCDSIINLNFDL